MSHDHIAQRANNNGAYRCMVKQTMLFAFAAFAGLAASPLELVRFPVDSRASFIPVSAFSNELLGWRAVADAAPASRRLAVRGGANCDSNFMQELTGGSGAIELYDVANGYNAYQTCYWRIKPTVPTGSITLFFSDFSLPAGGLVRAPPAAGRRPRAAGVARHIRCARGDAPTCKCLRLRVRLPSPWAFPPFPPLSPSSCSTLCRSFPCR